MSYGALNIAHQQSLESSSGFSKKMLENFTIERLFEKANVNKFRSYVYYFLIPSFLFVLLAPGLVVSIPPVKSCDSGVRTPDAPKRVTFLSALVHSLVFGIVLVIIFWWGSHNQITFPFATLSLKTT